MKNILIVEDHVSSRILLKKILKSGGFNVLEASNGKEALEILKNEKADLVLTDWMMPEIDGIELLKKIRILMTSPPPVIMITAIVSKEAKEKSILSGANGFIAKPITKEEVLKTVNSILNQVDYNKTVSVRIEPSTKTPNFNLVTIAASTGGPPTLNKIFEKISFTDKAAFVIVLHGPSWMLKSFSERLEKISKYKVILVKDKTKLQPGNIYVNPGDYHMEITNELEFKLIDAPPINFIKPSADPLFKSAATIFGKKTIGVVLTGMGHDGTIGSGYIKAAGGRIIAQDPATAILPAMPQSVIDLKIAGKVSPLEKIHLDIINSINRG